MNRVIIFKWYNSCKVFNRFEQCWSAFSLHCSASRCQYMMLYCTLRTMLSYTTRTVLCSTFMWILSWVSWCTLVTVLSCAPITLLNSEHCCSAMITARFQQCSAIRDVATFKDQAAMLKMMNMVVLWTHFFLRPMRESPHGISEEIGLGKPDMVIQNYWPRTTVLVHHRRRLLLR